MRTEFWDGMWPHPIWFGVMVALVGSGDPLAAATNAPARFAVDESGLSTEVRAATSLAPILKKASTSVVSISTTKYLRLPKSHPLLNDPMWRRFFGGPEEPQEGDRPNRRRSLSGLGSGVIVTEDGYILTNNHVIDEMDEIKVILSDGKTEYTARVVGKDDQTDLAVLKVEAGGLPAITLTDSDKLEVGDLVLAIGNPFGVGQTVTQGIVSALGRSGLAVLRYEDFIQTDASINPGNSGGALVDAMGRLVGINTLIFSESGSSAGVGFAIPANLARDVTDKIIRFGRVARGALGVELELEVTPDHVKAFDLPNAEGALVTKVLAEGAAAAAGLEAGDFIIEFNGRKVTDRRGLQMLVGQRAPKSKSTVKVLREGREKTFQVTLGELTLSASTGPETSPEVQAEVFEGLELAELSPSLRRQFEIPASADKGVLITQVDEGSAAFEKGLRPGCVILEVNREPVDSVDQAVTRAGRAGARVLLRVRHPSGAVSFVVLSAKEQGK